jgi:hypothetical protein
MLRLLLPAALLLTAAAEPGPSFHPGAQIPEARPFSDNPAAGTAIDAALTRAAASGKRVIVIFGDNSCHDSRGLAGWFATPRFAAMLRPRYEIVWVDIGRDNDHNIDIAARFGVAPVTGTPTVVIVDAAGRVLNAADAPAWRNAASRAGDDIYAYFEKR